MLGSPGISPRLSPELRRIKSEVKQQNILITFDQILQDKIKSVFHRIARQYASVYIFTSNQQKNAKKNKRNPLLTKRPIKYIYLQNYSPNLDVTTNGYTRMLHYCIKPNNRQLMDAKFEQMETIVIGENQDNNDIFKKSTKLMHLDFIWLGVGGRIGCSIAEFQQNVKAFQSFSNYQVTIIEKFLSKLNQIIYPAASQDQQKKQSQPDLKQGEQQFAPQIIKQILDKCTLMLGQNLRETQQQIREQICFRYNEHIFISNLSYHSYYKILKTRNYFKSVWIEEPVYKRYRNFKKLMTSRKCYQNLDKWIKNIDNFLLLDDYIYEKFQQRVAFEANFVINTGVTQQNYKQIIQKNYQYIFRKFRPDFDEYFISLCQILKLRGGCIKEAAGSIIVKNKRILSTGYNGTPIGSINCYNGGCRVCNDSGKINTEVLSCNCIHAQYSCIIEAGIQSTPGCTLYTTQLPCLWCAKVICQAKISTVVYMKNSCSMLSYENENAIRSLFELAKIELKQFDWQEKRFSKI